MGGNRRAVRAQRAVARGVVRTARRPPRERGGAPQRRLVSRLALSLAQQGGAGQGRAKRDMATWSPPDTAVRAATRRGATTGPSTLTRRVRHPHRCAGWARVERVGSSDELGQHHSARSIREEAAPTMPQPTVLSRRSTPPMPSPSRLSRRTLRPAEREHHPFGRCRQDHRRLSLQWREPPPLSPRTASRAPPSRSQRSRTARQTPPPRPRASSPGEAAPASRPGGARWRRWSARPSPTACAASAASRAWPARREGPACALDAALGVLHAAVPASPPVSQ